MDIKHLTVEIFTIIFEKMTSPRLEVEDFIKFVAVFHPKIVQSFYMFSTYLRDTQLIYKSRSRNFH